MPKWRKNGEVDGELEIKALQLIIVKTKNQLYNSPYHHFYGRDFLYSYNKK